MDGEKNQKAKNIFRRKLICMKLKIKFLKKVENLILKIPFRLSGEKYFSPFQNLRQKFDEENQIPQDDNNSIAKADEKS